MMHFILLQDLDLNFDDDDDDFQLDTAGAVSVQSLNTRFNTPNSLLGC